MLCAFLTAPGYIMVTSPGLTSWPSFKLGGPGRDGTDRSSAVSFSLGPAVGYHQLFDAEFSRFPMKRHAKAFRKQILPHHPHLLFGGAVRDLDDYVVPLGRQPLRTADLICLHVIGGNQQVTQGGVRPCNPRWIRRSGAAAGRTEVDPFVRQDGGRNFH